MTLSPPITVLAIVIAAMAGTALLAPPPNKKLTQVCVEVPTGSYEKLALRTRDKVRTDGSPQTVRGLIEELVTNLQ